jgi:Solitary outer membrane autotransporter beta-barrel domain
MVVPAHADITPDQARALQSVLSSRIEALTIFGGDYGLAGGSFVSHGKSSAGSPVDAELNVNKFGGSGDVGDPRPIGDSGIGWLPMVQGNMGYLDAKNHLQSETFDGDTNQFKTYVLEFGAGARFVFNDHFSIAPTISALYGHTSNDYSAVSTFMRGNYAEATQLGLINWAVDTWTVRPALNIQYVFKWDRTIFTLSSDPTYFRTETFHTSNPNVQVSGDSWTLANKLDVDIPLGARLFGYELRTGGYFSRTDLFGGIEEGLDIQHLYEVHTRLVLDCLNRWWKLSWVGIGASYVWGPNITGWTAGADIKFKF